MGILDLIFPKYCVVCKKLGSYLCPDCFATLSFDTKLFCAVCNGQSIYGLTHAGCLRKYTIDGIFASVVYNKTARKLLYAFKYKPYVFNLSKTLGRLFYEGIIQHEGFSKAYSHRPAIIPIPLHSSKLRRRGYNHAKLLANYLSKELSLPQQELLMRTKNTLSQYGLSRKQRMKNINNAFVSSFRIPQTPNAVFLIDDIVTTGSTFLEAAKVLKKIGVKRVWGLALARD